MTVNELEQALRNLIASQPMITSGSSGEVINSVLSIVYSYREFVFRLQSHPYQDALKFNMLNESQRVENDLVISVCQIMQERGINIMLYAPSNQYNTGAMQTAFSGQGAMPQNPQMGNMGYAAPQMNGFGMNMQSGQVPAGQPYPQQGFGYGPMQQPAQTQPQRGSKKAAPAFGDTSVPNAASKPTAPVSKPKKVEPKIEINVEKQPEEVIDEPVPAKEEKSSKKMAVDALLGDFQNEEPSGKAAGRDYLLELLKK